MKKYGPDEPQLYPAALAYFTSTPQVLEEAGPEVEAVLRKIQEDKLMAPLQVIQTLSTNAVATMGLVKSYLRETVGKERKEITEVGSCARQVTSSRKLTSRLESKDYHHVPRRHGGQTRRAVGTHFGACQVYQYPMQLMRLCS